MTTCQKAERNIRFSAPDIMQEDIDEVVSVLRSGWITTGALTKEFEKRIAVSAGVPNAVCLNSATAGLELCLRVLGIGPGDEVITTAYTYTATAAVIDHVGARIVMMDTAPGSFEMDYSKLADAIGEKTKAIIPVDIGGRMCDYASLWMAIRKKRHMFKAANEMQRLLNRVALIADASHSLGACSTGRKSGQIADFTVFSFHAVKNVTTSEGGAIVWPDRAGLDSNWLYRQLMLYALHGQSRDAYTKAQRHTWEYDILLPGYKYNMPDTLAALGKKQLERYGHTLARRRALIERYDAAIGSLGLQRLVHYDTYSASSGHLYLIRVPNASIEQRNALITYMEEQCGIECNVHYKPLPMMRAYQALGFHMENFPCAYQQFCNEISLPLHMGLSYDDVDYVMRSLQTGLWACGVRSAPVLTMRKPVLT